MRADKAREKKAKNSILIAEADESVNMLSAPRRMLFVNGTAAEAADSNKYATICISISISILLSSILGLGINNN